MKKRFLTMLLALVMVFSLFPTTALAGWGYGAGRRSTGKREPEPHAVKWSGDEKTGTSGLEVKVTGGADLVFTSLSVEMLDEDEAAQYFAAIKGAGRTLVNPIALNITLLKFGKEYQPTSNVQLSITRSGVTLSDTVYHFEDAEKEADEEVQPSIKAAPDRRGTLSSVGDDDESDDVYEIDKDTDASVVPALKFKTLTSSTSGETVTVNTNHFSVYVVDETTVPRLTVKFKNGGTDIASVIVKAEDTAEEVEKIVYDPGAGTLQEGEIFKGWTTVSSYTTDTELLTIAGVRTAVRSQAATITEDTIVTYYAGIFKAFSIIYLSDDDEPITVGTDVAEYPTYVTNPEVVYPVSMGYTVDDTHNFEGWTPKDATSEENIKNYPTGAASETVTENGETSTVYYYENGTNITVTGDVTFVARAPEGNWLIFNENGKGATYTAPQFVLKGDTTKTPSTIDRMERNGYTFGGWYYGKTETYTEIDDDGNEVEKEKEVIDETRPFTFGGTLTANTTIFAKWNAKTSANYSVLIWKQNIAGNGYDYAGSRVLSGTVDENVSSVVQVGSGNDAYAQIDGSAVTYTGFHLGRFDQDVKVVPEGTSVVNVYYDRNTYVLTFEVQRTNGSGTHYRYTRDDNNGTYGYINGTWVLLGTQAVGTTTTTEYYLAETANASYENRYTGPVYEENSWNGYTYHTEQNNPTYPNTYYRRTGNNIWNYQYHELYWCSREVEVDIVGYTYTDPTDGSTKIYTGPRFSRTTVDSGNGWYTVQTIVALYEQSIKDYFPIDGYENSRWSPQSNSVGLNQVLVYLDIMPAGDVTFHQSTANYSTKHIHYYVEALPGQTAERTYRGMGFVEYKTVDANYNYFTEAEDYIDLVGFSKGGTAYPPEAYNENQTQTVSNVWSNSNAIHVYCYYLRNSYKVNYMDGLYVSGRDVLLETRTSNQLTTSDEIDYGASLADCNITPSLPAGEVGYVFEGWYMDQACNRAYDFEHSTMPVDGVTVYAKWRQIQYRAFLHTGLTSDDGTNLSWGSTDQTLSFRVDYGGRLSAPTGTRDGYKFLGWYTDENFSKPFNETAFVFNEETVTKDYDKTVTMTDPETKSSTDMSLYGPWDVETEDAWNSDIIGWNGADRYWITKKLDIYAKWSKVLDGAEGINVVYTAAGYDIDGNSITGSNPPTDGATYLDNSDVSAGAAATAPEGYMFDHWVVCTYNTTSGEYEYTASSTTVLPGETFLISGDDAKVVEIDEDTKTYTVQLLAIYKEVEEETPTHINWYSNYGEENEGKGKLLRSDTGIQINEAVTIYGLASGESVPTRSGYTFKGWTKTQGGTTADFLVWTGTEYTATVDGQTITATQVAADEKTPIEDLYAVWEAQYFYIFHSATGKLEPVILTGTIDLTTHVADNCLYGGYYNSYGPYAVTPDDKAQAAAAGEAVTVTDKTYDGSKLKYEGNSRYWDKNAAGTVAGNAIPESSLSVGDVLYMKEVPDVYLASRLSFTYDVLKANELVKLYLLTAVDDTYYTSVTFSVKSNYTAKLVSSFTITQRNSTNKSVNKATDFAGVERGYLGYCEASDLLELGAGSTFTVTPQWTTLDGVPVSGTSRTFKFESLTNTGIKDVTNTNP